MAQSSILPMDRSRESRACVSWKRVSSISTKRLRSLMWAACSSLGKGAAAPGTAAAQVKLGRDRVQLILGQFILQFCHLLLGRKLGHALLQLQDLLPGLVAQLIRLGGCLHRLRTRAFGFCLARRVEDRQRDLDSHIEVVVLKAQVVLARSC